MAMFGRKKLPFGMPDYMTPGGGIGGGLPGMPGIDTSISEDPYAGERPEKPGFFGKGGGWKDTLGYGLGALAQQFGGSNPYEAKMEDERELARLEAVARLKADLEADDEQVVNLGDGGAATYSRRSGFNVLREPTQTPKTTSEMTNWNFRQGLPEDQRPEFDQLAGRNWVYTPQGIAAAGQLANARAAATAAHRAPPRGGKPQYEYRMSPDGQLMRRRIN